MKVCIPTYGRADKQLTVELLLKQDFPAEDIILFLEETESNLYGSYNVQKEVLKPTHGNLSAINNQILMKVREPYLWTCDDLTAFKKRIGHKKTYWVYEDCNLSEIVKGVSQILSSCAVVQIPTERRAVLRKKSFRYERIKNLHTCYFVNPDRLENINYDEQFRICEDYELGYQLLNKGVGALVDFSFAHNALHWGNTGGCVSWRDESLARATSVLLKKKYGERIKAIYNRTSKMIETRWKK
jgi:hypothetical protein